MIKDNIIEIRRGLPEGVKLVAVSKFRPAEELRQAYDAGQRVFAESRPLEFEAKVKALPADIEWHFIGHLQTNKLRHVLPYAHLIHSADSLRLIEAMNRFATTNSLTVNILLEVHVGLEQTKQGFAPAEVADILRTCADMKGIRVCGLMGMASHTDDTVRIEEDFAAMERLWNECRALPFTPECFTELSIGMSDDYRIALRHSATMVRIGSAIFLQ